ncbi:MAG: alpha/beta fold hydrolase [Candidatus Hydrogenedentes bacterium]|nr:alpha/beta fold hydrolase [Candidatus Hydrogenedentota bacterium]
MKSLCTFLEISFDASVLRPYEGDRMTDGVHKTSAPIGDPNFKNHDSIDASLGDVWRRTRLPRKLAGFARRVAAEFDYPLPVEVPGSGNMDVGLSADVPHVVAIQPKGTRPPFFCCAPGGGVSFMYFHLPEFMGEDQPIYALQDPALNPLIDPFTTVESLSAVQVKAIRKIQPKGPYHLGGWSFGGTVAFEMAQQLRAVGEEVAFFAAIDTEAPIDKHKRRTWRERLKGAWDQAKMSLKVLKSMPPYVRDIFYMYFSTLTKSNKGEGATASLWEHVTFAWADMIRHTLVKRADIAQVASRDSRVLLVAQPQTRRVFRVLRANIQSLKLYKPKPYDGPITLLRAEDQFLVHQLHDDWTLGWRELARGRVDVVEVPGNHAVLLTHPFVQTTGRALREGMDKAIKEFGGRAVEEDDASAPA